MAELSGSFSRLGNDCRIGYEIAKSQHTSGMNVIISDNQGDPKTAISEFHKLIDAENASIVVTTRSPVGLALNPLSKQMKLPLIGVVGHPRYISENPYAVQVFPTAIDEANSLAEYFKSKSHQRIATITIEDEYFLELKEKFEKQIANDKLIYSETVLPTEKDFLTAILNIRTKHPDAIFVNLGPAQIPQFIRKLKEANVNASVYANFLIGMADIRKSLGELAEGIIFSEIDYTQAEFMKSVFKVSGSNESSPIGYSCYIALNYALTLAEEVNKNHLTAVDILNSPLTLKTLDGTVEFEQRKAKLKVMPKIIQNGVIQIIK
ncbi:MAG: ABC transporter substrate-binding protein [Proteobacteria bacterium]|nr:ABC transporter substrate-binding protein [Pseudomonadota bacterium]